MEFKDELETLLNSHSQENGSNTPDFILAAYLTDCLQAFNAATQNRESWYGVRLAPGQDQGKVAVGGGSLSKALTRPVIAEFFGLE